MGFLWRCSIGKGPHIALRGESSDFPRGFLGSLQFLLSCDEDFRVPVILPEFSQGSFRGARVAQDFFQVAEGEMGLMSH